MDEAILNKIETIFENNNEPDALKLKNELIINCKKNYNQILQSGFSEYIAKAETQDYLEKVNKVIIQTNDYKKVYDLLNSTELSLLENIKKTAKEINLANNEKHVENIEENFPIQKNNNDKIKLEQVSQEQKINGTIKQTNSNNDKSNRKEKVTKYFKSLGTIVLAIGIIALCMYLVHQNITL